MDDYKKDFESSMGYIRSLEEKTINLERHIYRLQEEKKMFESVIKTLEQQNKELQNEKE